MRSSRLVAGALAAALLAALAAPPAGASPTAPALPSAGKDECKKKPKRGRPAEGCGSPSDDDDADYEWDTKWRFVDVQLDGTTTARYDDGERRYTIDGRTTYRAGKAGGILDLRRKKAIPPGVWVGQSGPVTVTSSSKAVYKDERSTVDCSWTPPRSLLPQELGATVSKKSGDMIVQWTLVPTAQKCPEDVETFDDTPLPLRAMTSKHRLGDHFGATKVLHVEIDETMRHTYGYLRVTWKGKVTLRKALAVD